MKLLTSVEAILFLRIPPDPKLLATRVYSERSTVLSGKLFPLKLSMPASTTPSNKPQLSFPIKENHTARERFHLPTSFPTIRV